MSLYQVTLYEFDWGLATNKRLESSLYVLPRLSLGFDVHYDWPRSRDHWGLRIYVDLLGCIWSLSVYDTRHAEDEL